MWALSKSPVTCSFLGRGPPLPPVCQDSWGQGKEKDYSAKNKVRVIKKSMGNNCKMKRSQNKCGGSIIFRDKVKSKSHIKLNNRWVRGMGRRSPLLCTVVRWAACPLKYSLLKAKYCPPETRIVQSRISLGKAICLFHVSTLDFSVALYMPVK